MDPFTISTGIAGFLSLAIELVKILTDYTSTVKSAPSDAQTLLTEVASLSQVLQQLTSFLKKPEHNINFRETSILCSVVTICDAKIKNLHSRLDKFRSAGGIRDRWKWPFQKQECLDIAQTLHHCAQTIELSLTISNGELLSRTSQELTTALADRKQQCDSMLALLQVIPPELRQMQNNINEVLQSVPIIESLASDLQKVILQLQHQNNASRLDSVRKWLSPLEPQKRHQDIKSTRISNTGEWVLGTEAYQAWIASTTPEDRILSFYGMPGAGKTFIASMMIDTLRTKIAGNPKIGVASLYCDYRDQKNQNIINIMGSLTNQLLELLSEKDLEVIFEQTAIENERKLGNHPSLKLMMVLLNSALKMFDQLFICLDAIDELEIETQNAFMKSVQEILNMSRNPQVDTPGGVFLCFTARPHVKDMVTQVLGDNYNLLSVTITANDDDIRKYIIHQLDIDPYRKLMNDDLRRQLLTKIPQNSQGMFLLSALQMQVILQELTIAKRKAAIEKLPTDLYAAFRISLERIRTSPRPARELGMKVLMWTHLARRQLHLEEVLHALAVEGGAIEDGAAGDGTTDLDPDNIPLEETILHCCNGLVVIDHETSGVRLVHYSLQEFFKLYGSDYFPEGHKEIARTCLTYLNFTPLLAHCTKEEELEHLLRRYHFLEYAAGQWGHHAVHQFDDALKFLALRLLDLERSSAAVQYCFFYLTVFRYPYYGAALDSDSTPPYQWWHSISDDERRELRVVSPPMECSGGIHVAAAFGLESIVQYLLTTPHWKGRKLNEIPSSPVDSDTQFYRWRSRNPILFQPPRTPLSFAAARGHDNLVFLLLQQPDIDINAPDWDFMVPLVNATINVHKGVVRLLLKHLNVDVNAKDSYGRSALSYAAEYNHQDIARLLLEHPNIDVNAKGRDGRTALSYATQYGYQDMVRLLLEHPNIDVNGKGRDGRTALSYATQYGYQDMVRLLLEHSNIDVNAKGRDGRTALSYATQYGYQDMVRLLLEHPNIDVNAKDSYGRSALSYAAEYDLQDIVRLLLEQSNIDVNAQDNHGRTALSYAHTEGVARLLLEHSNIDVNAKDSDGRTALSYAHTEGVARLLLEHPNIDFNTRGKGDNTPLLFAIQHCCDEVVSVLLECLNVDVNASNSQGDTPLSIAVGLESNYLNANKENTVRLLLKRPEINVITTNKQGQTPLAIAIDKGLNVIADLLRHHTSNNLTDATTLTTRCIEKGNWKRKCETDKEGESDTENKILDSSPKRNKITEI